MTNNHRTSPPRASQWEKIDLSTEKSGTWLDRSWPPPVLDRISSRLISALLKPELIRFFRSRIDLIDLTDHWTCSRFLGAGGFGHTALWINKNEHGGLEDEVVIKEDYEPTTTSRRSRARANPQYHMSREAWCQQQLNEDRPDNIIHLRRYKAISPRFQEEHEVWRFYLEYAPHGNLHNLKIRYKAFCRYLPELFLWHLFNSLARAAEILDEFPDGFFVHFDIKPENIFLGYEAGRKPLAETGGVNGKKFHFPTIKLGDFGLAEFYFDENLETLDKLANRGTIYFKAPELRHPPEDSRTSDVVQYGNDWTLPPNRVHDPITTKMNIWAIGKVMYDLFSLSIPKQYFPLRTATRQEYDRNGQTPLQNYHCTPFSADRVHQHSPYSLQLSTLIEQCMHLEPARRPSPGDLFNATRQAMHALRNSGENKSLVSVGHRKLYYRRNEINEMPIISRNCRHDLHSDEFFQLHKPDASDPDDPPLNVPEERLWALEEIRFHGLHKRLYQQDRMDEDAKFAYRDELLADGSKVKLADEEILFTDISKELTYPANNNQRVTRAATILVARVEKDPLQATAAQMPLVQRKAPAAPVAPMPVKLDARIAGAAATPQAPPRVAPPTQPKLVAAPAERSFVSLGNDDQDPFATQSPPIQPLPPRERAESPQQQDAPGNGRREAPQMALSNRSGGDRSSDAVLPSVRSDARHGSEGLFAAPSRKRRQADGPDSSIKRQRRRGS